IPLRLKVAAFEKPLLALAPDAHVVVGDCAQTSQIEIKCNFRLGCTQKAGVALAEQVVKVLVIGSQSDRDVADLNHTLDPFGRDDHAVSRSATWSRREFRQL